MQYSRFAVHERPLCVWDWNLAEITGTFLDTFDRGYFEYQVEVHIDQLDGEGARHAATAIRTTYCHAMETLFALLGATLQAPDCVAGWMQAYRSHELDDLVRKISTRKPVLTKLRLSAVSWKELSAVVHRCLALEDAQKADRIKDAFGKFWGHLAHDFLSSHARPEYNSIKHGFRVGSGGSYIHAGIEKTPGQACPPEEMKCVGGSEHGSSFYVAESIGDSKLNVRLRRTSRNWDGVALALRIKLIGMSLQNVVSCLRIGNGAEPSTVQFRWPQELDLFDEAMRGPSLRESTFGLLIEPKDIVPKDKAEILEIYDTQDAAR